jgi:hypothetical protein
VLKPMRQNADGLRKRNADAYSMMPKWRPRPNLAWCGIRRRENMSISMLLRRNLGGTRINGSWIAKLAQKCIDERELNHCNKR